MSAAVPAAVACASRAVLQVGDGRGFLIETPPAIAPSMSEQRLILTAAHCLSQLPPPHPMSYTDERTYRDLVAPLGADLTIWAECLFVSPVADLAVLTAPDGQELHEQAEHYEALVADATMLPIGERPQDGSVWALALTGEWLRMEMRDGFVMDPPFVGGMSGSPIVREDGAAVGVVSISCTDGACIEPWLWDDLPAWLVRRFQPRLQRACIDKKRIRGK